jgi:hypothetical protein
MVVVELELDLRAGSAGERALVRGHLDPCLIRRH